MWEAEMYGRLAQLVERGANNAKAGGSSPSLTILKTHAANLIAN